MYLCMYWTGSYRIYHQIVVPNDHRLVFMKFIKFTAAHCNPIVDTADNM